MLKLRKYPLLILFAAFILVLGVADMFVSRREFSEMENRQLTQRPPLEWESLISLDQETKFSNRYEKYINDQFIGRDGWITLKSICESALGKISNNGIVYGKNDRLFDKYMVADDWRIEKNIGFFQKFAEQYGDKTAITTAIVPNSYQVYSELMPYGLQNVDQQAYIETIYSKLPPKANPLDLLAVMQQDRTDSLYYRTDHHWTTEGAYRVYKAFVESRGKKAVTLEALQPLMREVPDFYGTYYNKCKLFSAKPDTITAYDIPFESMVVDGKEKTTLNDESKWSAHDKYAAFLWSNNGVTVLKTKNNLNAVPGKTSRVMLIKDSYGNCLAPFLTYSYDEVYVIDPRYIDKLSTVMEQTTFDDVFLLYNFMSFGTDTLIPRITY